MKIFGREFHRWGKWKRKQEGPILVWYRMCKHCWTVQKLEEILEIL